MAKTRRSSKGQAKVARKKTVRKVSRKRAKKGSGRPAKTDVYTSLRRAKQEIKRLKEKLKKDVERERRKGEERLEKERKERVRERTKLLKEANKAKAEASRLREEKEKLQRVIEEITKPPPKKTLEERLRESWEGGTLHLDIHDIADDFDIEVHEAWVEYEENVA